jgi:DNA-binding NarL/FixJ family response regulator
MTHLEQQIVELLDEGWARWKIADKIGIGESTVRDVIRRLCEEHQCSQRDLPKELLRKENNG